MSERPKPALGQRARVTGYSIAGKVVALFEGPPAVAVIGRLDSGRMRYAELLANLECAL